MNESDQTYSYGYFDGTGNYTLSFDTNTEGIIPGPKAVRFRSGKPAGSSEMSGSLADDVDPDEVLRLLQHFHRVTNRLINQSDSN